MKKVLVLVALTMVAAAPAMAVSVVNSKHNLSTGASLSGTGTVTSSNYDEVCVFCHTPHAANMAVDKAPLWNRNMSAASITPLYNSATIEASTAPSQVDVANSDAPLCFSCHDGASLAGNLVNPSNLAGGVQPSFAGTDAVSPDATIIGDGLGLSNDHPIGFVYATTQADDAEIRAANSASQVDANGTIPLYAGEMWCSSCHDVHNNEFAPFLNTSNSASKLCLMCHIK